MASPSEPEADEPARSSQGVIQRLWEGKAALHRRHSSLPPAEKVRLVMELQRMMLPLLARQRPLRSWERPWDVEP
jgi:hypothetical protein